MLLKELQEKFSEVCVELTETESGFHLETEDTGDSWNFNTIEEVNAFYQGFDFCIEQMTP